MTFPAGILTMLQLRRPCESHVASAEVPIVTQPGTYARGESQADLRLQAGVLHVVVNDCRHPQQSADGSGGDAHSRDHAMRPRVTAPVNWLIGNMVPPYPPALTAPHHCAWRPRRCLSGYAETEATSNAV